MTLTMALLCESSLSAADWHRVETKHFSVVGSASTNVLTTAALRLESTRAALATTLPWVKVDGNRALRVVIFATTAEYRDYKPRRANGETDDAVQGYFIAGEERDLITATAESSDELAAVLSHEYLHYALRSTYPGPKLPAWLDEGLAEYFASLSTGPNGRPTIGGERRNRMAPLKNGPFAEASIFFSDDARMQKGTDEERARFYAQAWLLARYLVGRPDGATRLKALADALIARDAADAALQKAFGITANDTVAMLARSLGQGLATRDVPVATGRGPASAATLSAADADAIVGELLFDLGRTVEAEQFLRRAVDDGADAHAGLGIVLAKQRSFGEATKVLALAIAHGHRGSATNFYYAYSMTEAGAVIDGLSESTMRSVRAALDASLETDPGYVPGLQLLAIVDLETGRAPEAETLLRTAIGQRPDDEELSSLLAQALLQREKYADAAAVAAKLTSSKLPKVRENAARVIDAVAEYRKASVNISLKSESSLPWETRLIFLKRSWLTQQDVDGAESDRANHNLNVMLGASAGPDEKRVLAKIIEVKCRGGRVEYRANVDGEEFAFTSTDFDSVRLAVLLEGAYSFRLDCGADLSQSRAVLGYTEPVAGRRVLNAISFVPDRFTLEEPRKVAGYRSVVVNDDRLRKGGGDTVLSQELTGAERVKAIMNDLRTPGGDEKRTVATITRVDCTGRSFLITARTETAEMRFRSAGAGTVAVRWFSNHNSQAVLMCGSEANIADALITYVPTGENEGELKSIEFLPADIRLPDSSR